MTTTARSESVQVEAAATTPTPISVVVLPEGVGIPGPRGLPGAPGRAQAPVEFVQATPAAVWIVQHGLGAYPASVRVLDSDRRQMLADVVDADRNTLTVTHATPTTGLVIIAGLSESESA